jgi:hypothetical protein
LLITYGLQIGGVAQKVEGRTFVRSSKWPGV